MAEGDLGTASEHNGSGLHDGDHRLARLEDELRAERRRGEQLKAREERLANQLKQATSALKRVESDHARLLAREAEFEEARNAQYWLDILTTSRSIRVTAPLRRLSAAASRLRR